MTHSAYRSFLWKFLYFLFQGGYLNSTFLLKVFPLLIVLLISYYKTKAPAHRVVRTRAQWAKAPHIWETIRCLRTHAHNPRSVCCFHRQTAFVSEDRSIDCLGSCRHLKAGNEARAPSLLARGAQQGSGTRLARRAQVVGAKQLVGPEGGFSSAKAIVPQWRRRGLFGAFFY